MWHAIYIFEHVSGTHRDLLIIIGLQMWLSSVYKINSNSPGTLQSKIYQKLLFIDVSRKHSNLKKKYLEILDHEYLFDFFKFELATISFRLSVADGKT